MSINWAALGVIVCDVELLVVRQAEQTALDYPHPHLLGNFVDNHDGARFLYQHSGKYLTRWKSI